MMDETERDGLQDRPEPVPSVDPQNIPCEGRLVGIDFGTVRMGLAVCDPSQRWVTPLTTFERSSQKRERRFFEELVAQHHVVGWIVGLPIHCDGNESQKSWEVREFARWLHQTTKIPVAYQDERFSSKEARRLLFDTGLSGRSKKQRLDRIAAYVILSNYLETRFSQSGTNASLSD